ncbi:MAG TPA: HAMP domain-containing sensor histidine kinase [Candidatus Saccharimonadales bacterium]|nr:HAMP domain-containing sensor histidine kinase [Candidatus Saccharimonadales bacterium]
MSRFSFSSFYDRVKEYFQVNTEQFSIFRSARLKLTGFYLIVILVFSLSLTIGVRGLAQLELDHTSLAQHGAVKRLFLHMYSVPPDPGSTFSHFESNQDAAISHTLNYDVVLINVVALVIGGIISYWFAGRTLRPIENAHEMQSRFAADASHELRTPLASLRVENEVFLKQNKFSEKDARGLIESNLEEVQRLEELSSHLLSLSQYEAIAIKLSALDAQTIVTASVEQNQKLADKKGIEFVTNIHPSKVRGNFDSLVHLLNIVIDNAIKYSPHKTKIFIDGLKIKNQYHISVRDQGPGISESDLPYIFDRLYRGDKSRTGQTSGYGLGLALGNQIAQINRATIVARNYPEGGAQFVVSLNVSKDK